MFLPLLFLLPGLCASASWHTQSPFSTSYGAESDSDYYKLKWPVKRVAIIGAGPRSVLQISSNFCTDNYGCGLVE